MRSPRQVLAARRKDERDRRRSRWRLVLAGGVGVLVVYYGLVLTNLGSGDSAEVSVDERGLARSDDRVTLQVEAAALDPGAGTLDLRVLPVPHGRFAAEGGAELQEPLQVRVSSPGQPPQVFDFPASQLVDPVAASATTSSGAHGFPFDHPRASFRLAASVASRDQPAGDGEEGVPVDVELTDETDGWNLAADVASSDGSLDVDLDAHREMLAISFALFYVAGIVVVALITVTVIGGAIARGRVDFNQVIWLGAMLVAIPAVRNEMPGVPPVGTLVDLFVFLPSVVIVALALLAAIVVLAIAEAAGPPDSGTGDTDTGPTDAISIATGGPAEGI
jgi:hypothetical protein